MAYTAWKHYTGGDTNGGWAPVRWTYSDSMNATGIPNYGEVFTRRWVVDALLDLTGYTIDRDLGALRLLEPSCGSGAFLGPAVVRLIASSLAEGRDFVSLRSAIRAYDVQLQHVERSRDLCGRLLVAAGCPPHVAQELSSTWVRHGDFLLDTDDEPVDVVLGNPPYIRYDDLPSNLATLYRRMWSTMQGRGDIYVGFIERSLRMLKAGGKVGFICADRWMRNQYGAGLRQLVAREFSVEHVWTMHDVDAFETEVSAYPAITILGNHPQASAVIANTTAAFDASSAAELLKGIRDDSSDSFTGVGFTAHRLAGWFEGGGLWPTGSPARLALIEELNKQHGPLHNPREGTRVSIGIATGADSVYVTKDPTVVEPDRILPLSMSLDLTTGKFTWHGNYLVNPWADDGSLVALERYPHLASYLQQHIEIRDRHVAKRQPESWYRTIDKVQAGLAGRPKLLIQDMKANMHPVLEPGGYYPHHNLYYVVSDTWDLEVLGGILLSRIAQAFIEAYCVRMRGGTLRFQAQYLRQIRVPQPDKIDPTTQRALRAAFRSRDVDAATVAAGTAYGVDLVKYNLAPLGVPRGQHDGDLRRLRRDDQSFLGWAGPPDAAANGNGKGRRRQSRVRHGRSTLGRATGLDRG